MIWAKMLMGLLGSLFKALGKLLPFLAVWKYSKDRAELVGKRQEIEDAERASEIDREVGSLSDDRLDERLRKWER